MALVVLGTPAFGATFGAGRSRGMVVMAVPKKRTSSSRKKIRHNVWMQKARKAADKALSLAKSVLTGRSNSFYYETDEPSPPPKCSGQDYAFTDEEMEFERPPLSNSNTGMLSILRQRIAAVMAFILALVMKLPRNCGNSQRGRIVL